MSMCWAQCPAPNKERGEVGAGDVHLSAYPAPSLAPLTKPAAALGAVPWKGPRGKERGSLQPTATKELTPAHDH